MSTESVMPSNHLILCRPLLLLTSIFPSIRVFSNESGLRIRWPKYWSFSFGILYPSSSQTLISVRFPWKTSSTTGCSPPPQVPGSGLLRVTEPESVHSQASLGPLPQGQPGFPPLLMVRLLLGAPSSPTQDSASQALLLRNLTCHFLKQQIGTLSVSLNDDCADKIR